MKPLTLPFQSPPPCDECGYDPAFHGLERWTIAVTVFFDPAMRVMERPARFFIPFFESFVDLTAPFVARGLARLGAATLVHAPDIHAGETAQCLWEEAEKRGIAMREVRLLGLPRRLFYAEFRGHSVAFEGLPRPARAQPSLVWIDDKEQMKRRFSRAGFPVARGEACKTERAALGLFRRLSKPLIAKPHIGSGGRHTAVHIETEEALRAAFRSAQRLSPRVMIEEELQGPVFRATLVGGRLAAVLRRNPPAVTGDGVRTVRELVNEENKNPLRRGPVFAEISPDSREAAVELARAGLVPEGVPAAGKIVPLHFKVNWGVGGTSYDVTGGVHPDNEALFTEIGRYLGNDIVGIDFMIPDITKSWKEQKRCGVIECNSLPHISNHHFPYTGKIQNVAGAVWDAVFPMSSPT